MNSKMELGKVQVYFRGNFVPLEDANVNILTQALHYGTAIFEGIRGYWDADSEDLYFFRLREHYERMKRNCKLLKIKLPVGVNEMCDFSAELVQRNQFKQNVYVRPLAYKATRGIGVKLGAEDDFFIVTVPFGDYLDTHKGLSVCTSSWRRTEDNAIPCRGKISGGYVNCALAADEALASGFDEAVMLTESGHVSEGPGFNLFMVRNHKLITPGETENILEGITRDAIIRLAQEELHLTVEVRKIDRSELYVCDELFFCGTAAQIAPIASVDHRVVGNGQMGLITAELQKLYNAVVLNKFPKYSEWCTAAYRYQRAAVEA
ncbi:MAG: branched-chain amino acid transaminase [Acidobacteriia bacterium]|nr:branched-chain amino acid transaminase [Terriglobia bacterium]